MTNRAAYAVEVEEPADQAPKHYRDRGGDKRGRDRRIEARLEDREMVAWDGEGMNLRGEGYPQSYMLFGNSTGARISTRERDGLTLFGLLDFMIAEKVKSPNAFHVGFAFDYDSNMIVQRLTDKQKLQFHKNKTVKLRHPNGATYRISRIPHKWFRITRYDANYSKKHNPTAKVSLTIDDMFAFFQRSFVETLREYGIPVPDHLVEGKARRGAFTLQEYEFMESYWEVEISLLKELAERFKGLVYNAGFRINRWYGPGLIASYVLKQHNIKEHMAIAPKEVNRAALHAYAGGRFEAFKLGTIRGPVFSLDLNSAYPSAIRYLPSLSNGHWERVLQPTGRTMFAVYRVRFGDSTQPTARIPGPLFWRDRKGHISYPPFGEGWYWSPELNVAQRYTRKLEVLEGWEFIEGQQAYKPFAFIEDMYRQRQLLKKLGDFTQLALKLAMNSIYGKLAQRVGWNAKTGRTPPWHQIEWAGWITSYCRARIMGRIISAPDAIIAVETDGFYTTQPPGTFGITDSKALGEWEVTVYDEITYIQSGVATLRKGDEVTCKVRGLDRDSFTGETVKAYIDSLHPLHEKEKWAPYMGSTTRFVTLGQALMSSTDTNAIHCTWKRDERAIGMGGGDEGKRLHSAKYCRACKAGIRPADGGHDTLVRSEILQQVVMFGSEGAMSTQHYLPWLNNVPTLANRKEIKNDESGLDTTEV